MGLLLAVIVFCITVSAISQQLPKFTDSATFSALTQQLQSLDSSSIPPGIANEAGKLIALSLVQHFKYNIAPRLPNISDALVNAKPNTEIKLLLPPIEQEIPLGHLHWKEIPGGPSSTLFVGDLNVCDSILNTGTFNQKLELKIASLIPPTAIVTFTIFVSPEIFGIHSVGANFLMNMFGVKSFGNYKAGIEKAAVGFKLNIGTNDNFFFDVRSFALDLNLEKINLDFGETFLNKKRVDWPSTSTNITEIFKDLWPIVEVIVNGVVSAPVSKLLNKFVSNCGIHDILKLLAGDYSCLGVELPREDKLYLENVFQLLEEFQVKDNSESCKIRYDTPPTPTPPPTTTENPFGRGSAHTQASIHSAILTLIFVKLYYAFN